MSILQQQVAAHFIARAKAQDMKGKKRDIAAVEFVTGAAAAAIAMHGNASKEWSQLSSMAFIVSLRGYSEVEKFAVDCKRVAL